MTDALRSDRPGPGEATDRDRDARIEELLVVGLDHYFAGQHELAINIWTRVLFLDRGHARARAYIERARGAVSERQREGEELVHAGAAALKRGDRAAARQLLTSAIERGSSGEEALALLHRLDRLEAAARHVTRPAPPHTRPEHRPFRESSQGRRDARVAWLAGGVLAGVLLAAVAGGYLWLISDPFELTGAPATIPSLGEQPLPVPAGCEIRLARARALASSGRLHDALAMLAPGDPDEQHRASYEGLRATIQRQLIEAGRRAAPAIAAGTPADAGARGGRSSAPARPRPSGSDAPDVPRK